jgi:hypothetical protein
MTALPNSARQAFFAAVLALFVAAGTSGALAQAPPPLGHWATYRAGEELYVHQNGWCSFLANHRVTVQGRCTWDATSRGGILTIIYPMPLEPGKVRYNIVWINRTTISVWGDIMHLQR